MKIERKSNKPNRKRKLGKVETVKCAIYARCASDHQSAASIENQVRHCVAYAKKNRWKIVKEFAKPDVGVSGTTLKGRNALLNLMKTAEHRPRLFDRVLIEDTSRLSRNLTDTLWLLGHFASNGIHVVSVSQGLDFSDRSARQLLVLHSLMDEHYLTALREKFSTVSTGRPERTE
ncbi:MAG TPA: recombinase family protein [Terriglobales bacterium]|jgi:DNA invertase Pin-like site-specific DNA recombinase|nr:recombinase family protein [Terriglobales bacterium]